MKLKQKLSLTIKDILSVKESEGSCGNAIVLFLKNSDELIVIPVEKNIKLHNISKKTMLKKINKKFVKNNKTECLLCSCDTEDYGVSFYIITENKMVIKNYTQKNKIGLDGVFFYHTLKNIKTVTNKESIKQTMSKILS